MSLEIVTGLEALNALLLLLLLYVYIQNYRQIKTSLGLGLIVFALFLLVQNLMALYFHLTMVDYYGAEVMQQAMLLDAAQTVALAALVYVTWRD